MQILAVWSFLRFYTVASFVAAPHQRVPRRLYRLVARLAV
jgi:hypothetical protein